MVRVSGRGGPADFVLSVPGRIERRFSGVLEIRDAGRELEAVVVMDLETAVASAVAPESAPGASIEAWKAQAVAARSFYTAARGRHTGFDFCDTTHCQHLREPPDAGAPAWAAAAATRGLVLLYSGRPFPALFSASCGGRTRTLAEAGLPGEGYPYFAAECEGCRAGAPAWETRLAAEYAPLVEDRSEARRLELARKLGWSVLPSSNYKVSREGRVIVLRGRGQGHGIGLCQRGAGAMAASGANFRTILAHYYPNTSVAASPF